MSLKALTCVGGPYHGCEYEIDIGFQTRIDIPTLTEPICKEVGPAEIPKGNLESEDIKFICYHLKSYGYEGGGQEHYLQYSEIDCHKALQIMLASCTELKTLREELNKNYDR